MATLELKRTEVDRPRRLAVPKAGVNRATVMLGAGLFVVTTYAIFAQGAIQAPAEPRVQVALAMLVAAIAGVGLWAGSLRLSAPRSALIALALLAGFSVWGGISLAWSVAPDLTWVEFNRTVAYVLVLGLAIVLGASARGSVELVAGGFLALMLLVTLYALGQKIVPGLHIAGLLNLNQTGKIARLQEPIGYWNALAALFAMGAPIALSFAIRPATNRRVRLAGAAALQLMFVTGTFTYSRGGLFALVFGLVVCITFSGAWLQMLLWTAAIGLIALAPAGLGLATHALSANGVALGQREHAGLLLGVVEVCCLTVLVLGADRLIDLERTTTLSPESRRAIVRVLRAAAVFAALAVVIALTVSTRGLSGTISHFWSSFTSTHGVSVSDPSRLLSADSANRWVWWKEAAGAFWSRPLAGWGAGSFPVVHLLYRHDTISVLHAHSVPLEWLAETGLIGFLLAAGAWVLLVRTGLSAVRRRLPSEQRLLAGALLAGALAYSLHALYDWDWDIPGITIPALILLGTLAGSLRAAPASPPAGLLMPSYRSGPGLRLLGLAAAVFGLCVYSVSAVLPSMASDRASDALVAAGIGTPAALTQAQRDASVAERLDPFSDAGLQASAAIAQQRQDLPLARTYLLQAVNRQPSDGFAWRELAFVESESGDVRQAVAAAQHMVDLDPEGVDTNELAQVVAQQANVRLAPPADSATAQATPPSRP